MSSSGSRISSKRSRTSARRWRDRSRAQNSALPSASRRVTAWSASRGNDEGLRALARDNALAIGAGHSFILFLRDCFPINVLNAVNNFQEVCTISCAKANPAEVVIAETAQGRGIMGVIDGQKPRGVEGTDGVVWRTNLLRKFGYKRG